MEAKKTARCYIRFSTEKQDQVRQEDVIRSFAEREGLDIVEMVIEQESGGKSFKARKLNGLLEKMQEGEILLCADELRLCRSMGQMSDLYNNYFKPKKLQVYYCLEGKKLDYTIMGELVSMLMQFKGQSDLDYMSKTSRAGFKAKKELWDNAPDGYTYTSLKGKSYIKGKDKSPFEFGSESGPKVEYQKRQSTREDVQTYTEVIKKMYKAGKYPAEIAEALNDMGFRSARGGRFYDVSIRRVLQKI